MTVETNVQAIRIEQALYGEHRRGHSLLVASGDREVSAEIVQRLDLPDTAPPGVEWSPFLRGFPYRDRYVLARTFLDPNASRGGMVFSHALIAPLDDIVEWRDLRLLLQYLATSDGQRPDATTVDVFYTESRLPDSNDLTNLAEILASPGRLPAVRVSRDGFGDLVVALWARLARGIRRNFAFRLSFGPGDLVETPQPMLVCTPQVMVARWSDYRMIGSGPSHGPSSLAAAALSGCETSAPLLEFMNEIGTEPTKFDELRLIERAYRLSVDEPTLEHSIGVVRLVEKLSPNPDAGRERKEGFVRQLCELLPTAKAEQILWLRNLQLSAFPSSSRVWQALEAWTAENTFPEEQDSEMLSAIADATTHTAAVAEWRAALHKGLTAAAHSRKSGFADAFWRWIRANPDIVTAVFRHIPTGRDMEKRLAAVPPQELEEASVETLVKLARSRGWLRVHGAALSAAYGPLDAVRRQVEADTDSSFVDGLRLALRQARPADVVECAIAIDDPRVTSLAGEAVAKNPKLLSKVDLTRTNAQAIWREALVIDPGTWQGPADPKAIFHAILDSLLDGRSTDPSLIDRLSQTPVADLGGYPRRSEVWSRVSDITHDNILAATAEGWLQCAEGGSIPFKPDQDLQSVILATDKLEPTLNTLISGRIGTAVRIIAALDQYDQRGFSCLLQSAISGSRSLPVLDSEGIGRLVLERRWNKVADNLAERYRSGRRDLKPALRACLSLFGPWRGFFLGVTPPSETEKWEAFEELAADLYPGGPDGDELWQRAGGNNSDLKQQGSGRTRWRQALRKIRYGKKPYPSALLQKIQEDYPKNEHIRYFVDNHVFGAPTDC